MNIKSVILLCIIVLFVPAIVLASDLSTPHQQRLVAAPQPRDRRAMLADNNPNQRQMELNAYKQEIQNRFHRLAHEKEQLEAELLQIVAMEDELFGDEFTSRIENMSDFSFKINKCSACKAGVKKVVSTFGCGSFVVSYKSCLPLVSTLVGVAVCGATVFAAKKTIVSMCKKYTKISTVANKAATYVCSKKLHWC